MQEQSKIKKLGKKSTKELPQLWQEKVIVDMK